MVHILTHRVFYELFMLACHMLVCSFLYCIYLLLHASVPSHFLPSVSSFCFLACIPPLAVGLASKFPSLLTIQSPCPFLVCPLLVPGHTDLYMLTSHPHRRWFISPSIPSVWLKASQVCVILFHNIWLPVILHKKSCIFYSKILYVALFLHFLLLYSINTWFFQFWAGTSWLQMEIGSRGM